MAAVCRTIGSGSLCSGFRASPASAARNGRGGPTTSVIVQPLGCLLAASPAEVGQESVAARDRLQVGLTWRSDTSQHDPLQLTHPSLEVVKVVADNSAGKCGEGLGCLVERIQYSFILAAPDHQLCTRAR